MESDNLSPLRRQIHRDAEAVAKISPRNREMYERELRGVFKHKEEPRTEIM